MTKEKRYVSHKDRVQYILEGNDREDLAELALRCMSAQDEAEIDQEIRDQEWAPE